ncbi:MAG: DUF5666 domain-containing protein [Actinomycetota bacterium]
MKSNRLTRAASVTAISAGLFAGTFGIASAATTHHPAKATTHATSTAPTQGAPGDHRGPGGFRGLGGVITAINGSTLTVSGPDGRSISIVLTSTTTVSRDGATATQASLAVGDHINVRPDMASLPATRPATPPTSLNASAIDVRSPGIGGKVVSVDTSGSTSTIVVADKQGFYRTMLTNAATTYENNGATGSLADVTVGKLVRGLGAVDANHTTLDASSIVVGQPKAPTMSGGMPGGEGPGGPGFGGPGGF